MPKYVKSRKGEMQRKKFRGFDSLAHMTQFLSRCDKKTWTEYRKIAKDYLTGKKTPPQRLRKTVLRKILRNSPQRLVGHVEREHRYHRHKPKNSKLGGGISPLFRWMIVWSYARAPAGCFCIAFPVVYAVLLKRLSVSLAERPYMVSRDTLTAWSTVVTKTGGQSVTSRYCVNCVY